MTNKNIIKEEIRRQLVREVATYYVESGNTMRKTATIFGKSKSWVHGILRLEVKEKCPDLLSNVDKAINVNKKARALRGGLANKRNKSMNNK